MALIQKYLSLIKFSHTVFALPFALVGFFMGVRSLMSEAEEVVIDFGFYAFSLLLVVLCMVFARSAAMAFNRYLDRHFDAQNPRTVIREIPAGILSANQVLWFVMVMSVLFMLTAWMINTICFALSPIALVVILGYSYTKRFTALCHVVLGVGLSLAPIGAYLAITGYFAWLPILFSLTVLCWVSGFDIIYALQDEQFDRSQQLHSIPVALGKVKALIVSELLHLLSAAFVCTAGYLGNFGSLYWCGVTVFIGMLVYQHRLVKPSDLSKVNIAFMTANGIASVVFAVFVLLDIFI